MEKDVLKRNNVRTYGHGTQPILFAHGFGCDNNMWRFVTPAFEKDYQVVVFDYVGSGNSDLTAYNKDRYASLDGYAQDVLDICNALQLKDVIFVGHSVSSMIGMLAAIKEPQFFAKVIMIGPSPCYINDNNYTGGFKRQDIESLLETMEKNYIGWSNFLAPAIMGNSDRPALGQELVDSFCSTDPIIARQFAEVTFFSDNRKDLHQLKTPTLILQCAEDIIAPKEVGEFLYKQLPNSELVFLQATGHCPHMSAPEETISAITDYLNKERLN
jgi:sigma-B regulation protein RsbQ